MAILTLNSDIKIRSAEGEVLLWKDKQIWSASRSCGCNASYSQRFLRNRHRDTPPFRKAGRSSCPSERLWNSSVQSFTLLCLQLEIQVDAAVIPFSLVCLSWASSADGKHVWEWDCRLCLYHMALSRKLDLIQLALFYFFSNTIKVNSQGPVILFFPSRVFSLVLVVDLI